MPDIAYIDVIDACPLKCPACVRGVRNMPNTSRKMPLDQYVRVLEKLKAEGYTRAELFSWTEPFLNRTLQDYTRAAKVAGFKVGLSTTFSLRHIDNLEDVLLTGVDMMIVSLSGADQKTHERYHVGGNLDYTIKNLELTRALLDKHKIGTGVYVRLIRFDYNASAEAAISDLAKRLGFLFQVIEGFGHPDKPAANFEAMPREFFVDQIAAAGSARQKIENGVCPLAFDQITIDCEGDVYLCCAVPNYDVVKIGAYLDISDHELLFRRFNHPLCPTCDRPRRPATGMDEARLFALQAAQG